MVLSFLNNVVGVYEVDSEGNFNENKSSLELGPEETVTNLEHPQESENVS